MKAEDFFKLTDDERTQLFYNCRLAATCKCCGSIACMNNCQCRMTVTKNEKTAG